MPTGFRRPITATLHVPTASGSLVQVDGGYNAAGHVAVDLFEGDGTGFDNFYTDYDLSVQFIPGVAKRWDAGLQGYRFLGECSIKVDARYADLIDSGSHFTINGVEWNFSRLSNLGVGFSNDRIVLALTRKKDG